tara:strand:+ start:217 stop:750 length:534 start_codon:yes stop_codon:yes gene_type:complete
MFKFDKTKKFIPINICILTVSDTRTLDNDKSGNLLEEKISSSGHKIFERKIVKDDKMKISEQLIKWTKNDIIDVIISTGGTGLTGRDVTVEAHKEIYEKEIDAFSTFFTIVSSKKIGTSAIQSRACGGVCNGTFLFALPGSPSACRDAWDEILFFQLDNRHLPCNFIEILPRLNEGC